MHRRILVGILVGLLIGVPGAPSGYAQAPVVGDSPPPAALSAAQLEELQMPKSSWCSPLVSFDCVACFFALSWYFTYRSPIATLTSSGVYPFP